MVYFIDKTLKDRIAHIAMINNTVQLNLFVVTLQRFVKWYHLGKIVCTSIHSIVVEPGDAGANGCCGRYNFFSCHCPVCAVTLNCGLDSVGVEYIRKQLPFKSFITQCFKLSTQVDKFVDLICITRYILVGNLDKRLNIMRRNCFFCQFAIVVT